MSKPHITLTKTCSSCGLQKSLSAFLQLSATEGSTYGNICSSCRKTNLEKPKSTESEETTRREAGGSKIRTSERIAAETDKLLQRKQLEELYRKEQEKEDKSRVEQVQKVKTKAEGEKKHRQTFLEKRSFPDKPSEKYTSSEQVFGGEQQKAEESRIDFSVPVVDTQISGKIKYQQGIAMESPLFERFRGFIRGAKQSSQQQKKTAEKAAGDTAEKEPLAEHVKQTWKPKL